MTLRKLYSGLGLLIFVLLSPLPAGAESDYGQLADRHGLQQTFPDGSAQPVTMPGGMTIPTASIDISQSLLLLLGAVIVGVFGFYIVRNALAYRRLNRGFNAQGDDGEPVEVWGTVPEDNWDALLGRLRLSADLNVALHEMLLAAIGFCQQELAIHIPRARTPREIQQGLPTDFQGAEAFETLVQGAELAWFGAKPVDRPMFQQGLDALERIIRLR